MGRKGEGSKLWYQGHVLTENRNGLVVEAKLSVASGGAKRETALELIEPWASGSRVTLGGDRGYRTRGFVGQRSSSGRGPSRPPLPQLARTADAYFSSLLAGARKVG